MDIVALIEFRNKEGKERSLFNFTKAFKAIISWIVTILNRWNNTIIIDVIYESWYDCTQARLWFTEYCLKLDLQLKSHTNEQKTGLCFSFFWRAGNS